MKSFFIILVVTFGSSLSIIPGYKNMRYTEENANSHDTGRSFFDLPFLSNWSDKKHKRFVAMPLQSWDEMAD